MKKRIVSIILVTALMFNSIQIFAVSIDDASAYSYASTSVSASESTKSATIKAEPKNGAVTVTLKVAYKLLKKYKTNIIKAVSKVNKNWGKTLSKKYTKLLDYMETARGVAESVLTRGLVAIGFSQSTAEIIADIILTIIEWVI